MRDLAMKQNEFTILICAAAIILVAVGIVLANLPQSTGMPPQAGEVLSDRSTTATPVPAPLATTKTIVSAVLTIPTNPPVMGSATITHDQALVLAKDAFSDLGADRVNITYLAGTPHNQPSFEFELFRDNERLIQGGLNPNNGKLTWYAVPIKRFGRQNNPSITIDAAHNAADSEIRNRDGVLTLNMSESRYDLLGASKVAGVYVFVYTRLAKNVPCENDGFTLSVDSISGKVVEYRKTWVGAPDTNSFC